MKNIISILFLFISIYGFGQADGKIRYTQLKPIPASHITSLQDSVSVNTDVLANTTARHVAVTLAGEDYLSLSTQQITANEIDTLNINLVEFEAFVGNHSAGGATQLSDLSDVNTSTPTNRNVLVADGVDWESRALTESDISDLGSYQPLDAGLTSISGLTTVADKMIYTTASDVYVVTDLTAFARTILDDADAPTVRATIGAGIGDGDMVLVSAQTNSGIKTFLNTTMKLRNVANTFDGYFVNTNTADRIYTLQDGAGTLAFTSDIAAQVYPGAGIALSTGSAWGTSITDNSTNWNTAYTDRLKWDGGATDLVAATGRTSLGGTTVGQNIFTKTNPSAITFLRVNADNTVDLLSATNFRTAIGAGTGNGDALVANPLSQFTATTSAQLAGVISDETGSGLLVFGTSPSLTTPSLGVATATTINGATITSGTLNGTVTGTNTGDQTLTIAGTTSPTIALSGSNTATFAGAGIVTLGQSAGTITITGTEVDGSVSNELQTIANTSDATTHTATLSNSGGSIQLVEGSNITLTTTGTGLNGIVTIASTASGGAPVDATYITQTANGTLTNEQVLGLLATGIVKNTTTTGVLSIAVAGDFPTLNQSTTGSAATLTTPRTIAGVSFDGSANISLNNNAITNGAGYTTNTGDIEGITTAATSGLAGGVTSGTATLVTNFDRLVLNSTAIDNVADFLAFHNTSLGYNEKIAFESLDADFFGSGVATNGYVLTANGIGGAGWVASSGGGGTVTSIGIASTDLDVSNSPITSSGDITLNIKSNIIDEPNLNVTNAPTDNYVLSYNAAGTNFTWIPDAGGFTDPMTTRGDIMIRNISNVTDRLAIGTNTHVLTSNGSDPYWAVSTGSGVSFGAEDQIPVTNSTTDDFDYTSSFKYSATTGMSISEGISFTNAAKISMYETTAPGTPSANSGHIYMDVSDDKLYFKNSAATYDLTAGSSGSLWTDGGTFIYPTNGEDLKLDGTGNQEVLFRNSSYATAYYSAGSNAGGSWSINYSSDGSSYTKSIEVFSDGDVDILGDLGATNPVSSVTSKGYVTDIQGVSTGTTNMNWTLGAIGTLSLTANSAVTVTNLPDGGSGMIVVTRDATTTETFSIAGSTGYTTEVYSGGFSTINDQANGITRVKYERVGANLHVSMIWDE